MNGIPAVRCVSALIAPDPQGIDRRRDALLVLGTDIQVCNLMWSLNSNEIVSTHGYSGGPISNQIHVWRYPSMTQVATLTGHTLRVLYLAMSPDGQTIVTGAGDETLRFWNAFDKAPGKKSMAGGGGQGGDGSPFLQIR